MIFDIAIEQAGNTVAGKSFPAENAASVGACVKEVMDGLLSTNPKFPFLNGDVVVKIGSLKEDGRP